MVEVYAGQEDSTSGKNTISCTVLMTNYTPFFFLEDKILDSCLL
jgi:hypothetical protein